MRIKKISQAAFIEALATNADIKRALIYQRFQQGASFAVICREFGISRSTVYYHRKGYQALLALIENRASNV